MLRKPNAKHQERQEWQDYQECRDCLERRECRLEGSQEKPSLSFKFFFSFAVFSKVICHLANVMGQHLPCCPTFSFILANYTGIANLRCLVQKKNNCSTILQFQILDFLFIWVYWLKVWYGEAGSLGILLTFTFLLHTYKVSHVCSWFKTRSTEQKVLLDMWNSHIRQTLN